jgi:hypothetical protein
VKKLLLLLLFLFLVPSAKSQTQINCPPPNGCKITGSAVITESAPATQTVTLSPNTTNLSVNGTQNFSAKVTNDPFNRGVSWALTGAGCSGATCGTLSKATSMSDEVIVYTAPGTTPTPNTVTLIATSVTNPQVNSSALASIAVTTPPANTVVNSCAPNVQNAALLNTFSCPPSQGSAPAILIGSSTATTVTGVQVCTAANICTNMVQGCPPTGACAAAIAGGMATGYYALGLPPGQTTYKVSNSPFGNQIQVFVFDQSNLTSFDTAIIGGSGTPSTNPSLAINTQAAGTVLSIDSTLNVSNVSAPFVYVAAPSNSVGGAGSTITSSGGTYTPTWTQQSAGYALYSMAFANGFVSPVVGINVNPPTASQATSSTLQITATVSNSSNGVTWTLTGAGCFGATCGTISAASSASGVPITYTAPGSVPSPAQVTVTAAAVDDPTKIATSVITVTPAPVIAVTVNPTTVTLTANATQNFSCTVVNDGALAGCDWTLGGTSPQGTLSTAHTASGISLTYTAGASASSGVTLTAASTTDATKTAAAAITVTAPVVSVSLNPTIATLNAGGITQSFTATIVNSASGVNLALSCPLSNCGTVPATATSGSPFNYTSPAPNTSVTVTLTATSISDGTKSATATINVNSTNNTQFKCTSPCPAFPEAQGGGAAAAGGRGGVVYNVTSLGDGTNSGCFPFNPDSVACSLRDCIQASGARNCIFRVSGLITQKSANNISSPFITIAGQTAPGGGIVQGGIGQNGQALVIQNHDVIIRYMTYDGIASSGGATGAGCNHNTGSVGLEVDDNNNYNIVVDHNSHRWWGNKDMEMVSNGPGQNVHDITMQWNLLYEPCAAHPVITEPDTFGGGSQLASVNQDWHHNMGLNYDHRWPLLNIGSLRWVNNIGYNGLQNSDSFNFSAWGALKADIIGSNYVDGPDSGFGVFNVAIQADPNNSGDPSDCAPGCDNKPPLTPSIYMLNNQGHSGTNTGGSPIAVTNVVNDSANTGMAAQVTNAEGAKNPTAIPGGWLRSTPLPAETFPIKADPVTTLDNVMLATIGNSRRLDCNGNWVTNRDSQDARVIAQYQARGHGGPWNPTGSVSPATYTGPAAGPSIPGGTPCTETLHDGIPDAWKTRYGLNTGNANLHKTIDPSTGLTYLEDYLDGLVP